MTDDNQTPNPNQNLTPAKPVAPRRKLPANPRMAQPVRPPMPEAPTPPPAPVPEPIEQMALEEERIEQQLVAVAPDVEQVVEVAPVAEAFSPVQPVLERDEPVAAVPEVALAVAPAVVAPALVAPTPEAAPPAPVPAAPEIDFPKTMRDTLRKMDDSFGAFRAAAVRFPSERMDQRIGPDGWTYKQMLEHVAAWHDLTADRVIKMINTGESVPLDRDTDNFNAAVARQAVGKTSGEVLKDIDATFNRLRRQLARVTDAQLSNDDWWLAWVIGGNTYGHYEEHWADIYTPDLPFNGRARR
jgi:hypothetical protein